MRALLVNPWIHDFAAYDLWAKPLGLLKIASCLKQCGVEVSLIDCLDRNHLLLKRYLKNKLPRSSIYGCGNYYSEVVDKPGIFKSIPRRYKRYGLPRELFEELLKVEVQPDIILVTSGMTYWYPGVFEAIRIIKKKFSQTLLVLGGIYARLCTKHALKIMDDLIKRNLRANFHTPNGLHIRYISPDVVKFLKVSGFTRARLQGDRRIYSVCR